MGGDVDGASRDVRVVPVAKQARSELSTRRLLQAAGELIAEVGYDRATLAAIGERAGYSHGLVTRRFGSKERLLWALVERMTVDWGDRHLRAAVADRVGVDALVVIIAFVRDGIRRSPDNMRMLYALMFEALRPVPVLREQMVAFHADFRADVEQHVRRGIEAGVVRADVDPVAVGGLFVGALRGAAFQWLLDPHDFDVDAALAAFASHLDSTLRAEVPAATATREPAPGAERRDAPTPSPVPAAGRGASEDRRTS